MHKATCDVALCARFVSRHASLRSESLKSEMTRPLLGLVNRGPTRLDPGFMPSRAQFDRCDSWPNRIYSHTAINPCQVQITVAMARPDRGPTELRPISKLGSESDFFLADPIRTWIVPVSCELGPKKSDSSLGNDARKKSLCFFRKRSYDVYKQLSGTDPKPRRGRKCFKARSTKGCKNKWQAMNKEVIWFLACDIFYTPLCNLVVFWEVYLLRLRLA